MPNSQNYNIAVLKVHTVLVWCQTLGKHMVQPPLYPSFGLLINHKRKTAVPPIPSLQMLAQPYPLLSQGKGPHSTTADNCCLLLANTIQLKQEPEEKQF